MARPANVDDANMILRLYEMRREDKMREARSWFMANCKVKTVEQWKKLCPPGSQENANFRQVTSYWEMVASFLNADVLHDELFLQSGFELLLCWERVRHMLAEYREMMQNPRSFYNLEKAALRLIAMLDKNGPEAYQAFVGRVGVP